MTDLQSEAKLVTFAAFGCVHVPYQDQAAVDKLCSVIEERRPDYLLCLGDLFEADSANVHKHRAEERIPLSDEYASGAAVLEQVAEAAPDAERLWLLGNHDDNLQTNDVRRIPKHLRDLVHWNKSEWGKTFRNWRQIPYEKSERGVFRLGQVNFYHGYLAGVNSDELEAIQMNNYVGGYSHTLGVRVHTHTPLPPTQAMLTNKIPLPFWYANAGTLGPTRPDYMKRKDSSGWGPAVVVGEAVIGRPSRMRGGPQWTAETVRL